MEFFDLLNTACEKEGLSFDTGKYEKFIMYKDMIKEWNEKINLTAITDDEQIIKKHFIDSVKIFKFTPLKNAKKIIDIGTGGGFPGIPIKIVSPETDVTLLDSLNKRIIFLTEVINKLELNNIKAVHSRAEDYIKDSKSREKFDAVVSRAVANMCVLSEICIPYVKVDGYFVALKGPSIDEELNEAKNAIGTLGGKIEDIIKVEIEETDLKHNLVVIRKIKETPAAFPRKAGIISKKPIK